MATIYLYPGAANPNNIVLGDPGVISSASHFLSLAFLPKLQYGTRPVDFIAGPFSNTAATVELRLNDNAGYSREDMLIQLEALQRFFENGQEVIGAGFVLKVK